MESTVQSFQKKIDHLDNLLKSETARRTQIGMTFRSFFKDTMIEIQQYGSEKRALTNAVLAERFEETKKRLEELATRIPVEEQQMLDNITQKTDAIRMQVDHFLNVECAAESTNCKGRHQALVEAIGTSAMRVEDDMGAARRQRQNAMDELRDQLKGASELASKNANRLKEKLRYELAGLKNALTTEALLRELADTQLSLMMSRQVAVLMQSSKAVNSTLGIDEVDSIDYASEATLLSRQRRIEQRLKEHLLLERQAKLEATAAAAAADSAAAEITKPANTTGKGDGNAEQNLEPAIQEEAT